MPKINSFNWKMSMSISIQFQISINGRKVVCFVCQVEISQTMVAFVVLLVLSKDINDLGCTESSFHHVSTYGGEIIEYRLKNSLKILNLYLNL
jgi:hypothetical protein